MDRLLDEIRSCTICSKFLPLGPKPIVAGSPKSQLLIIGQAPGSKVHETGIPWDDPSGNQLRKWLGLSSSDFYDQDKIALMPMGFCYPGKGKSGDLAPRQECAPEWHDKLLENLTSVKLTLLIGQYAQKYYLQDNVRGTLTETVRAYEEFLPTYLPMPHPSPRNRIWLKKNEWFENDVIPVLQERVNLLFGYS